MMTLIDQHKYETIDEFLEDIELIKRNALEYNPAKTAEDRIIRHRAHNLVDRAYSLIKGDINPAFDAKCRAAKQAKVQREQEAKDRKASEEAIKKGINGDGNGEIEKENLACGEELESAKQSLTPPIGDQVENGGKKSQSRCKIVAKRKLALAATTTKVAEVEMIHIKEEKGKVYVLKGVDLLFLTHDFSEFIINVDIVKLYQMAHRFVANTDGWSLYALESLYFTLMGLIQSHLKESDKSELLQQIQVELDKLEESLAVS